MITFLVIFSSVVAGEACLLFACIEFIGSFEVSRFFGDERRRKRRIGLALATASAVFYCVAVLVHWLA